MLLLLKSDKNLSCSGIYCKMKFSKTKKNRTKPNNIFVALSAFVVIKQVRFRWWKV